LVSVNAPCTELAMRPESWDVAAIAKARGWIDDIRLGCIASFAEIAEREAQRRGSAAWVWPRRRSADRRRSRKAPDASDKENL
jgi:hypothetical protein